MAITKVYAIRSRLDKSVSYAANEEKTSLDGSIEYAINSDKTEQRLFESCLNCRSTETAFDDMQSTKQRYGKMEGVLGYHFIQSFKPEELNPEQAHEYGMEFARRLFGERFQVVIGTHLDKDHLHNHIVINAVSFLDGKKYHSTPSSYYNEIRGTSDQICMEHDLSVIAPKGKGKHYAQWKAESDGKPTIRSQLRMDIEKLVVQSLNFNTFLDVLQQNGYAVKYGNVKHTAIKPPYSKRFIRLYSLGENYTDEAISKRILSQKTWEKKPPPQPKKRYRCKGSFQNHPKVSGFMALYFRYIYLIRATQGKKKRRRRNVPVEESIKLKRYIAQHHFINDNHIITMDDLAIVKQSTEIEMESIKEVRAILYKEKRSAKELEIVEAITTRIAKCTRQLKPLRHHIYLCTQIEKTAEELKQKTKDATNRQMKKEEKNNELRRRSNRPHPKGYR